MLEILKAAYDRPQALTQNRHHNLINKGSIPKYIYDYYPVNQEYYHEFNPYFVHLIAKETLFPEFRVFTVRDGIYTFADFLLKYMKEIPKWKTTFLVPASYAPIIPPQLQDQFFSYAISQKKKPDIQKAKTVIVFALLCDQYLSSYEDVEKKLSAIRGLPEDVKIEVCVSLRKSPLLQDEKENLHFIHIPEMIRKAAGNREITWLRMRDLMDKTILKDAYLLDLIHDNTLTCDSFLHYLFLSKGGMVNALPATTGKKNLFEIDLSFHHVLEVNPLPPVAKNAFVDLLFFTKLNKGELWSHPKFHAEVQKHITTSGYHNS